MPSPRDVLAEACGRAGFPAPPEGAAIGDWILGTLDVALAPRGGAAWQAGVALLADAADAAHAGNVAFTEKILREVTHMARFAPRTPCACPEPRLRAVPSGDAMACPKCLCRRP